MDLSIFKGTARASDMSQIMSAFYDAIAFSFQKEKRPQPWPDNLIRERFAICLKIFMRMRADLKWGLDRSLDNLGSYLGLEIAGVEWGNDERQCWVPDDGRPE